MMPLPFRPLALIACSLTALAAPADARRIVPTPARTADSTQIEQIIIFRHGEKPQPIGYGQLNCAGLNRSLQLPQKLASYYAMPDKLYAPDPHYQIPDGPPPPPPTPQFFYIRPLATIEPLAIQLRMPVDVQFHYDDLTGLMGDMLAPQYHGNTLYVAWEHSQINNLVAALKTRFNSNVTVPTMQNDDYDYIFAFSIDWSAATPTLSFQLGHENITPSATCPYPAVWIWNGATARPSVKRHTKHRARTPR